MEGIKQSDHPDSISELLDSYWYKNCRFGYHTVKTGFAMLDGCSKGWHAGELCIVGGRPAMGKTAFVLSAAANILRQNQSVAIFSATDTLHPVFINRIIKTLNRYTIDLEEAEISKSDISLDDIPLFLYLKPKLTLDFIRTKAKELKRQCDLNIIFIETLQSIYESKHEGVEEVCYTLKDIATEIGVPVVVTCECEIWKGDLAEKWNSVEVSDLLNGTTIKDIADSIYILNRPEYYKVYEDKDGYDLRGIIDLFVVKKKYTEGGRFRLGFKRDPDASIYDLEGVEQKKNCELTPDTKELMDFLNRYYQTDQDMGVLATL